MQSTAASDVLSFGPFRLSPNERILLRNEEPIALGSRGFDILLALLARPNEIIGKRELLHAVWPDAIVEETSLRFHIANLRKALGDGVDGARYITTAAGRGYCFVAKVSKTSAPLALPEKNDATLKGNVPTRIQATIGRVDEIRSIALHLASKRLVTILGLGGVGKTTVAIEVARGLATSFDGDVAFVDLGSLHDARLVAATIATVLGLAVESEDATPPLVARLRDRHLLLILDTCEHLVDSVASVVSDLLAGTTRIHILATSREALRIEGEHVFDLGPLAYPPVDANLGTDALQAFPAVQLFLERVRGSGVDVELLDADLEIIAHICRRLDGVALAIELAAGRVRSYGLAKTASLLDERLALLWPGRRTAPARQRTLHAALDWSYELLSDDERTVLRRLAIFVGYFTFEGALQVVADDVLDGSRVFSAIESLIDKSIVSVHPLRAMMRYRLLDTTRTYALQLEGDDRAQHRLAERHADYYRRWLEQAASELPQWSSAEEREPYLAALGNVRAALEWCFSSAGDTRLGAVLAAAAAPVFLAISLLTECHRWSARALGVMPHSMVGGIEEMRLNAGLGMSLMFTQDHSDKALDALSRSLDIARERNEHGEQLLLLAPLHMFHYRRAEYRKTLVIARRSAEAALALGDPSAIAVARCLHGISLHTMGELVRAREELEASTRLTETQQRSRTLYLGFDYFNWAGIALSRTLWMLGRANEAMAQLDRTIHDADVLGHPVAQTMVLHWAAAVQLWAGNLDASEHLISRFVARAETHALVPYLSVGHGLCGYLAIRRGDAAQGVEMLQTALARLHAVRYELVTTPFHLALAEGLSASGQTSDAIALIDRTILQVEANGDLAYMPELLRVKAKLLRQAALCLDDGQSLLEDAIAWARRQSAKAWELRSAVDLATILSEQGKSDRATALLEPILAALEDNGDTADLVAARTLLATVG